MAEMLQVLNKEVVKRRLINFARNLEGFSEKHLSDLRSTWNVVEAGVLDAIKEQFAKEGYPQAWKRLNPDYQDWKNEHYPGGSILVATGRLKRAATGQSGEYLVRKTKSSLRMGVKASVKYAKIHAAGGMIGRRFVKPRRKKALHWRHKGKDYFSMGHEIGPTRIPKRDYTRIPRDKWSEIEDEARWTMLENLRKEIKQRG